MGEELYNESNIAKTIFDQADDILGENISDLCFHGPEEQLNLTKNCQVAVYTMSYACHAVFKEQNPFLTPVATAGLSLGEYTALAAAGIISFEDGLRLVQKRAKYMEQACMEHPNGGMAAVIGGNRDDIIAVCKQFDIDTANFNCPGQIVISGEKDNVELACAELKSKGVKRAIPLKVSGAFHSRMMTSAANALEADLLAAPMHLTDIPVIHNFTAEIAHSEEELRCNLKHQVNGSVRWDDSVRLISERYGADEFIEFGPGTVLTGLIRKIIPGVSLRNI